MLIPKPSFSSIEQYRPSQQPFAVPLEVPAPNPWSVLLGVGLVLGGLWIAAELFGPQPAPRRRRRRYQAEPVSIADKEYVSLRDGWQCVYCGRRVSRGSRHIDHRVSRTNGGTNHLNNLCLACASCNLSKGPLNSREFIRSFR
jgi:hypothetical protein